jgi:hypothetical protein
MNEEMIKCNQRELFHLNPTSETDPTSDTTISLERSHVVQVGNH